MPITVKPGYTDTPISGVTTQTFPRGNVNFGADFSIKSCKGNDELILINKTSPIGDSEKFRIAYAEVANVYKGTGVEAPAGQFGKKGVNVLVQLTNTLTVSDTDKGAAIKLPISAHLVIKVPASEYTTSAIVVNHIGRLLSGLFETGSATNGRLDALLRGSLEPKDM